MSRETLEWLNTMTLKGFTEKTGDAWHKSEEARKGNPDNHYVGPIPIGDVRDRLLNWQAVARRVAVEVPATVEDMTHMSDKGEPMRWQVEEERQAIARSDSHHVMGLFKAGYKPHQYDEWLLGTVSNILGDRLHIGSAGLLRGGAQAWVQVEVPESIQTPEGMEFRPNLLAFTSFDGSLATTFKRTHTIVVCDNTREAAASERGQQYKAKHTKNSGFKLADARAAVAVVEQSADEFAEEIAAMARVTVTDRQWFKFLDALSPRVDDNGEPLTGRAMTMATGKQDALSRLWTRDARVSQWKNTKLGVVQAVNTWGTHEQIVRGMSRTERNRANAITGATAKQDDEALVILNRVLSNV